MNEENELFDFIKTFTGKTAGVPAELHKKDVQLGAVERLIEQNIAGLLSQPSLTQSQVDVLNLLLNIWSNQKITGKT